MSNRSVVPGPFRGKVRHHLRRLGIAQPRVGVDPLDPVLPVDHRALRRHRWLGGDRAGGRGLRLFGRHGGQRSAARLLALLGILLASLAPGLALSRVDPAVVALLDRIGVLP